MSFKEISWLRREKYGGNKGPNFEADVLRLEKGEPLDHVIGYTDFLEAKIAVDEKVLIPRTETEYWAGHVIRELSDFDSEHATLSVLDLFSGSGCIGIALLNHLPQSFVTFADKSPAAVEKIHENLSENAIPADRFRVLTSDVFEHIPEQFDVITANPPYISKDAMETVEPSVLAYEPHDALFAGDNGLAYLKKLLREAPNHLKSGGVLYTEFGRDQQEALQTFIRKELPDAYDKTAFFKDQYGQPRFLRVSLA